MKKEEALTNFSILLGPCFLSHCPGSNNSSQLSPGCPFKVAGQRRDLPGGGNPVLGIKGLRWAVWCGGVGGVAVHVCVGNVGRDCFHEFFKRCLIGWLEVGSVW